MIPDDKFPTIWVLSAANGQAPAKRAAGTDYISLHVMVGSSVLLDSTCSMSFTIVFDWSAEQADWLNRRYSDCTSVQDQDYINTTWSRITADFLDRWPVKDMLWPSIHSSHSPTRLQSRCILEAERMCAVFIKHYLNAKRREDGRFLFADHIGHWSIEQYVWLDERRVWHVVADALEDVETFWMILFSDFFTIWPVRAFLWPTLAADRPLSTVQQRLVTEAEEQCARQSTYTNASETVRDLRQRADRQNVQSVAYRFIMGLKNVSTLMT
ncbi:hypothetical protein CY34DRAFT_111243 [Suillus luteus UH-Slu-Lm8-n1]|uniref:Uncharacterized protein n=1 Tax=Suillus luteus UH-Slu-Lm8-n1 TaxID=930992 RepID=A0A0D0ABY4_9AGAM|nr:hypothetical protein CY34DRAFT_111243 [Suillus luteus UH-Slu-Lm8-n1]